MNNINVKLFTIGFFILPFLIWVGVFVASVMIGFVQWVNPLEFHSEFFKDFLESDMLSRSLRILFIIGIVNGVLMIKIYKYLTQDQE